MCRRLWLGDRKAVTIPIFNFPCREWRRPCQKGREGSRRVPAKALGKLLPQFVDVESKCPGRLPPYGNALRVSRGAKWRALNDGLECALGRQPRQMIGVGPSVVA